MAIITSDEVLKHVEGLGLDVNVCNRVIIDIQRGRLVEIHAYMMGNDSVVDIIEAIAGADLKVVPRARSTPNPEWLYPRWPIRIKIFRHWSFGHRHWIEVGENTFQTVYHLGFWRIIMGPDR